MPPQDPPERKVTWIELFFDLVFVAAAHHVAGLLTHAKGFEILGVLFLFLIILWIWVDHTLFTSRFEGRWVLYHILTFATMAGVLALTVQMEGAYSELIRTFAWTYVALRVVLLGMYFFALLRHPTRLLYLLPMLIGYSASAVLWFVSVIFSLHWIFWVGALFLDMATPLFTRKLLNKVPVHPQHFPERLGLLTVIMLGEMVIALVLGVEGVELTQSVVSVLILGIISVGIIFSVYFRLLEKHIIPSGKSAWHLYTYIHFPLYIGLVCIAAGFKKAIKHPEEFGFIVVGMILFIFALRVLTFIRDERWAKRQLIMLGIFLPVFIAFPFLAPTSLISLIILTGLFVLYLIITEFVLAIVRQSKPPPGSSFQW